MRHINLHVRSMLSILAMLTISACATTLTSTVDTADHANLNGFKTYALIDDGRLFNSSTQAPEVVNPLNEQRTRTAITEELERKGYQQASLAQADFVVAFTLGARDRVRVQNYYDDLGYGYYGYHSGFSRFGRGFGGFGRNSVSVRTFTEGTLVVDIFSNKEAIWHGSATKRLSREGSTRQLIDEAVTTLLAQFPDSGSMGDMPFEIGEAS
ncbi:MAG: DUF4136 domain-containing protein [Pseudomonadales bacterium]